MLRPADILYGIVLPFAIALLAFALVWRPWQKREALPARSRCVAGLGILIAFVAAYFLLQGILPRPVRFPPRDSTHWLFFFTPVIAVALMIDALVRMKWWLRAVGGILVSGALMSLLLWKPIVSAQWLAIAIAAAALVVIATEHVSHRVGGPAMPLLFVIFAGATAIVIGSSGSQKLGQMTGVLAAAGGASVVIALWRGRTFTMSRSAFPLALLVTALLFCGKFFARVEPMHVWLLLAAPLCAWAASMIPLRRYWLRTALIVALGAAPAAVAATQSVIRFRAEAAEFL